MKRIFVLIVITALVLSGCSALSQPDQSMTDSGMATRVSQLLTAMPTSTGQPAQVKQAPTLILPSATTQVMVVTAVPATATSTATALPTELSATPADTATATMAATSTTPTVTGTLPAATATAGPTATISPNDPRQRLGNPAYRDTMDNGNTWPSGEDPYTSIDIHDGWMYLYALDKYDGWRLTFPELQDFYLEATIRSQQCGAGDHWGLIARVPDKSDANQGYLFGINCDGQFSLRKFDGTVGKNGTMTTLINWKASKAIQKGPNQTNRLGLMAVGNRLICYINGVMVGEGKDSAYTQGYFGVFIGEKSTLKLGIAVDEIDYWENPTP